MLQWKLVENDPFEPSLSGQDVISFKHDIFRSWARVVGDSTLSHPPIHLVTKESLYSTGFSPWWQPIDKLCGGVFGVNDFCIQTCYTEAWDGMLGGRIEAILCDTPRRNHGLVRTFFRPFKPVRAILPEIVWDEKTRTNSADVDTPRLRISRFKDNLYIVLMSVPRHFQHFVREGVSVLLATVYGIAVKWEPDGNFVVWGEGRVSSNTVGMVQLQRAGVALDLQHLPPIVEWSR